MKTTLTEAMVASVQGDGVQRKYNLPQLSELLKVRMHPPKSRTKPASQATTLSAGILLSIDSSIGATIRAKTTPSSLTMSNLIIQISWR